MVKDLKKARKIVEKKIYDTMDIVDKTGNNTEYYKKLFAKMPDQEFYKFFQQDFPLKLQTITFKVEPKMNDILDGLEFLGVPVNESVNMPFYYENKDGVPVQSEEVNVVYLPLKRLKQMVQKKTGWSVDIDKRDMRTGNLIDTDKNGNSTDREFESLVVQGMSWTMRELMTYRADAMDAKNRFYNEINTTGMVSQKDVPIESDDSIARNLLSAYLLGCHIQSNLVNVDDFLPRTLKRKDPKQRGITRK